MILVFRRAALIIAIVWGTALLMAPAANAATHDVVSFSGFSPGTIVINTSERRLYYVIDGGHALRFPVGVGKAGMTWTGNARVEGKFVRPAWAPPASIRRENPKLPRVIAGGSPHNPMGAAALTLRGGEYAVQRRHPRALSPGRCRHAGRRRAVMRSPM
jgi:lipoprotein-anchoring transpeptidase ErfK/SrfK